MLAILVTVGFYRLPNAPDTAPRQIETSTAVVSATPPAAPRTTEERIDKLLRDSIWTDDADARATLVGDTLKVQLHDVMNFDTIDVIRNAIQISCPTPSRSCGRSLRSRCIGPSTSLTCAGTSSAKKARELCLPSQRREHQLGQRARRKPDVSGRRCVDPPRPPEG